MFLGGSTLGTSTAARRARRPGATAGRGTGRPQARTLALIAAAVAGTGLLALGAVAWTTPTSVAVTRPVHLQQRVAMTYDAPAPRGAAYPTGTLRTGDPVFLRLVPTMDVLIAYRAGPDAAALQGTRRVTAELRSANGWHRGFELLAREAFTGGRFDATAPVDLKRVQALIRGVEAATGIDDGTYTLSVRSEIALGGSISGADREAAATAVRESFFPELTFAYDGRQLQLADPRGAGGSSAEVVRSQVSTIGVPGIAAGQLGVLGLDLPVRPVRIGALVAGAVLLVGAGLIERARRRTPQSRKVHRILLDDGPAASRSRVPRPRTTTTPERSAPDRATAPAALADRSDRSDRQWTRITRS